MGNITFSRKGLREDIYFQMAGLPGRLYLDLFSFGSVDLSPNLSGGDNQAHDLQDTRVLNLTPDPGKQTSKLFFDALAKFRANGLSRSVADGMSICSITAEWKPKGRVEKTTPVLMFFDCKFADLAESKKPVFTIPYGNYVFVGRFLSKTSW